ncbi:MAG TPA: tetratricopeptide repeat protein [Verrucomicrobiae bacterium]|nr:tetratricopeptide repeat protein [Verrucomicrobiae bacterium]
MEYVTLEKMAPTATIDPASVSQQHTEGATTRSSWIYGPWRDLIIGCGAWSAPLLLFSYYASTASTKGWSFAFYALALLFNYPHFMATVYRAYHSYDEFAKYRVYTVHVALLLVFAGLIAHLWYPIVPWIFTLYICWSPWHYTGQNYGLLMMFTRRAGLTPTESERQALHLAFIASYLMLLVSFHTGASPDPLIISLGLPAQFTLPVRVMLGLFFLIASAWALVSLSRRSSWKALLPSCTLVSTQFFWFLLPALIELASGKEVPQTRYSSGILAVLHSAQYLWITSYYQAKEARAAGQTAWSFSRYLLILVAGGIALFIPGPWLASRVFHADFATSFLTFMALVNLHHFLLDGAIWKLRDSRIAWFLLNKREAAPKVQTSPSRTAAFFRWIAGTTFTARSLRVALIVLLLLWGAMDQLRFYWANVSAGLSSLQRAARLNPNDSSLQTHLARAADLAGDRDLALASLQHAAAVNPSNISFQEAYARGLILAGRDADAYALYHEVLLRSPQNANALINYGLLAQRLGHPEEAVDTWQRAVAADPIQPNAQLYLAQALEQKGELQAAARHYQAYLQIVAKHPASYVGAGSVVISALIKVADADAADQKISQALIGYAKAAQFAEKMKNPALQSLALAHAADAQERAGRLGDAAQSFQAALIIDETQGETHDAATDWFNYGQFLHRHNQPERLVFACFDRAQDLMSTNPGDALNAMAAAVTASQARLGPAARSLPSQLSKLLSEALSLQPSAFSPQ